MMDIISFDIVEQHLGPLSYPLVACSLIALVVLIERFLILSFQSVTGRLHKTSRSVLKHHQTASRTLREDIAAVWLKQQQARLSNGIRLLNIIALLAPLLGLLGTVIGLIQVFDSLGVHKGPIEPSLLAEGLGIAMKTTAAGLIIALPAVLGAHGFQLWVDKFIQGIEHDMNIHNLTLEGVCTEALA